MSKISEIIDRYAGLLEKNFNLLTNHSKYNNLYRTERRISQAVQPAYEHFVTKHLEELEEEHGITIKDETLKHIIVTHLLLNSGLKDKYFSEELEEREEEFKGLIRKIDPENKASLEDYISESCNFGKDIALNGKTALTKLYESVFSELKS